MRITKWLGISAVLALVACGGSSQPQSGVDAPAFYSTAGAANSKWEVSGAGELRLQWDEKITDHIAYTGTLAGTLLTGSQQFAQKTFSLTSGSHTITGTFDDPYTTSGVTFDGAPVSMTFQGFF